MLPPVPLMWLPLVAMNVPRVASHRKPPVVPEMPAVTAVVTGVCWPAANTSEPTVSVTTGGFVRVDDGPELEWQAAHEFIAREAFAGTLLTPDATPAARELKTP